MVKTLSNLEKMLFGFDLVEDKPLDNYEKLYWGIITNPEFNEFVAEYSSEHSLKPLFYDRLRTNTANIIIAHVLYNTFEKYQEKGFSPGLLKNQGPLRKSNLNIDFENEFDKTYYFFNRHFQANGLTTISNKLADAGIGIKYAKQKYIKREFTDHHRSIQDIAEQIKNPEKKKEYLEIRNEILQNPEAWS